MFFVKKIIGKDIDPKEFIGMLIITKRELYGLCLLSYVVGILVSSLFFNI